MLFTFISHRIHIISSKQEGWVYAIKRDPVHAEIQLFN
jgi:hypothetical protein